MLVIYACSENKENGVIPPFEDQDISLEEKMKIAVSEAYLAQIGLPDSTYKFLKSYYAKRSYTPRWINDSSLTHLGRQLKNALDHPHMIGLPAGRLIHTKTENFIQDELNITIGLAMAMHDLKNGVLDYEKKKMKKRRFVPASEFDELAKFEEKGDVRRQFVQFGPSDSIYEILANGLIDFVDAYPLDTTTFDIKTQKVDSALAVEKTRLALISKGYLSKDKIDTATVSSALSRFQEDNGLKPDGVIGKYTSMALNESTAHKVERILLSMDKIRSRPRRPEKYIHINLPEYKLRYYINDSLKSDHNVVIGKFENQTPELESSLKKIVVYPYWNVPYSISSKEILPAAKYSSGYFAKHNYKIYKGGVEVDPTTVNWKGIGQNSFPFKVVQEPGPRNSLGVLKFDFNNAHSVYFHDTPAKGLFGADVRAYSHGCMRTQHPVDLAKTILERDIVGRKENEMISDSLDSLLARGNNYTIKLLDPIPIFVEYQSVTRNQNNRMIVYIDIYGRDEEYLKIMRE